MSDSGMGGVDIRLPMGLMFSIIGAVIAGFGFFTKGSDIYQQHSLGININLWWGIVLFVFGICMLLLSLMNKRKA